MLLAAAMCCRLRGRFRKQLLDGSQQLAASMLLLLLFVLLLSQWLCDLVPGPAGGSRTEWLLVHRLLPGVHGEHS